MTLECFKDDLFDRREMAERLLKKIPNIIKGTVISIDAPWGDGKTYFAANLKKMLDNKGASSVLIDAFKFDYMDDPFTLLISAIFNDLDNKPNKTVRDKIDTLISQGCEIARATGGALIKGGIKVVSLNILDEKFQEEVVEAISTAASEASGEIFNNQIKEYCDNKIKVEQFRKTLTQIALSCKNSKKNLQRLPLIVLIDEMDRCSPTFAVNLLERIKHFFDVDNVIFILFANKCQLVQYIKGEYGDGVDGEGYLEKFIDISINLSSLPSGQTQSNSYYYAQNCPYKPEKFLKMNIEII